MTIDSVLFGMVDADRVPHSILLHEDDGGGALRIVVGFLKYLFCKHRSDGKACEGCPSCNKISKFIHPDIHFVFPTASDRVSSQYMEEFRTLAVDNPDFTEAELNAALGMDKKNSLIAVGEAKHILEVLSLSALERGYKVVVMYLPERMNRDAANRLLKIVEEPSDKTLFLFISHAPEKVLETISSRCQRMRVPNASAGRMPEFSSPELLDALMEALLARNLPLALDTSEKIAALPTRESAKAFCRYAAEAMRQLFLVQQGMDTLSLNDGNYALWAARCRKTFPRQALEALSRARTLIDRNVNAKILFTDLVDRLYVNI